MEVGKRGTRGKTLSEERVRGGAHQLRKHQPGLWQTLSSCRVCTPHTLPRRASHSGHSALLSAARKEWGVCRSPESSPLCASMLSTGIPALGGFVLPRMTPGQKAGLVATSSPAAVEILRGRLGTDADAQTRLRRTASGDDDTVATPLVQLRKTVLTNNAATAAGGGGGSSGSFMGTPGIAGPNSELAAAIQRRAQRQQQLEAAEAAA